MASKTERELHDAEISVEFEDAREEALVRQAVVGRDVRDWFDTTAGRFVRGAAVQEQRQIEQELVTIPPMGEENIQRIEELRKKHSAIAYAISWLAEAVKIGQESERELQQNYVEGDDYGR